MKFYAEKFERAFVQLVVRKAGCTESALKEFAIKVWHDKDEKRAHEKIKLLTEGYQGKRAGKQQRLVFGDAQRMAQVLNQPLGYLVTLAEENVKREAQGLEPY
ncbi:hypothetical protein LJC23_00020 [Desulfovibrio sp. OttesenSCG-928-I05]|nr:hypothetical protein [Desulfovibrio sp. OttesenSCG-928-O18]MDL2271401.1 hypothetical protein [Desulfovibrio sp. OttesenSCG-928-I05]